MRPGGGKQKGAQFERDVCKQLSRWLSGGEREDLFWRSAMSGGRTTVRTKQGKHDADNQAGDVTAIDPVGKRLTDVFLIECKYYREWNWRGLLRHQGNLWKVVEQLTGQAASFGRHPMLFLRENLCPLRILVDDDGANILHECSPTIFGLPLAVYHEWLFVFDSDDVLQPETAKEFLRRSWEGEF